jgi:outer membrane protein assembly factor BamB
LARQRSFLACLTLLIAAGSAWAVDNWPEFRGPGGDGMALGSRLPSKWSETARVKWKVAIHGKGWSSPVIWGDQIWLTTATEDGKQMSALCVDASSGAIRHDLVVLENANPAFCHPTNSYASPTPVVEAGRVYVHFGSYGTACLDTATGKKVWERRDLACDHFRGPGASPILYDDKLYFAQDGFDLQYVVALDKHSGETVWRTDRNIDYQSTDGDLKKAYCTCQIIEHDGRVQLISPSAAATIAYDPQTGAELWRVRHGGMNTATRPLYAHGLVYITVGDSVGTVKPSLLAIRPDGQGDVSNTHVAWTIDQSAPKRPSPLIVDDLLFTINDEGVAMCLRAATGEVVWRKRISGNYRASPICADGKIYFLNLEGDVTVIAAADEYRELAVNHLDNGFQASPAVRHNALFLRSTQHLYCIE